MYSRATSSLLKPASRNGTLLLTLSIVATSLGLYWVTVNMARKKQAKASTGPPARTRRSKIAKDNNISPEEEAEITAAWNLFKQNDVGEFDDEKEGVLHTQAVSSALRAQGIQPKSKAELQEFLDILDPEGEGYVTYPHFVEFCAIQINNKSDETKAEEIDKAFRLFTKGGDRPITLHDLQSVAKTLREDVSDDVLKSMILEANGGAGISKGVDLEAFRTVMTRAGVFQ